MFTYPVLSSAGGSAAYVKSVEQVTITVTGALSTATLSKGQDPSMCVPFFSHNQTGEYGGDDSASNAAMEINIYDDGGTPTVSIEKDLSTARGAWSVFVVEFGGDVNVQKIQWETTLPAELKDWSVSCSAVDTAKSFLINTYKFNSAPADSDDWQDWAVRSSFVDSTTVAMGRGAGNASATPGGFMTGYLYVVEDPSGTLFTVDEYTTTTSSTSPTQTISAVDLSKTMLIFSYEVYSGDVGNNGQHVIGRMTDTTTITYNDYKGHEKEITAYVITWNDGTTVQHINDDYTSVNASALRTRNVSIPTSVDPDNSIAVFTNQNARGISHQSNYDSSFAYSESGNRLAISLDGSTVDLTAYSRDAFGPNDYESNIEIVEFNIP